MSWFIVNKVLLAVISAFAVASGLASATLAVAAPHQVIYKLWAESEPLLAADVGYNANNGSRTQLTRVQLPWSQTIAWDDPGKRPLVNVNAFNNDGANRVNCQILVDGLVVDEDGRTQSATCAYVFDDAS